MPVPPYQFFLEPTLRVLAEHPDGLRASEAHEAVARRLGLSETDRAETISSGQLTFKNRNGWAQDRLKRAGLSESPSFGTWRLTSAGVSFAETHVGPLTNEEIRELMDVGDAPDASDPASESPAAPAARVWLIALGRNADQWETCYRTGTIAIGWNELGSLTEYATLQAVRERLRQQRATDADPINAGLACWQFAHEMREGDAVYVKRGRHAIIGHGVIASGYRYEPSKPLAHVRDVMWQGRGEWRPREKALNLKTLTEIGKYPALVSDIRAAIAETPDDEREVDNPTPVEVPPYGFADAERDLFIERAQLVEMEALCRYKKNIILQGPPGVGKTFVATRLAHLLIGSADEAQVQRVQFHPSYAYEDFVQGLRPTEGGGFERKDGPLLTFCKDALEDQASPYVLIIDEINRGNVSKILGELLSLLEADKRDPRHGVTLTYARDGEPRFHVPPNLYVIGMMNTADRALALVDYALRRRFAFVDLEPAFGTERFDADLERRGVDAALRRSIRERFVALNEQIALDPTLGPGSRIGHSYFTQPADAYDEEWYGRIIKYEIAPLLREYWFDNSSRFEEALSDLRGG